MWVTMTRVNCRFACCQNRLGLKHNNMYLFDWVNNEWLDICF